MESKHVLLGMVFTIFLTGSAYASAALPPAQYPSARLDINPAITNSQAYSNQNNVYKPASYNYYQAKPTPTNANYQSATKNMYSQNNYQQNSTVSGYKPIQNATVNYAQNNYQKQGVNNLNAVTAGIQYSSNPASMTKDLQIEGRIEKTQKNPLYTNQTPQEMQQLIHDIGMDIVRKNGLSNSVKFRYVDDKTVNANTNMYGTVTVYKGLLQYCEDYDELAYVIGHEIGHAESDHVLKSTVAHSASGIATKAALFGIAQATGNQWAATGVKTAATLGTGLAEKKYSRVHEFDADLLSVDYLVKAGFNPLASISMINKIGENYPDFWQDHPSTDKRIIKMYNYIKEKYPQYLEQGYDSVAYHQAIQDYIQYQPVSRQYN